MFWLTLPSLLFVWGSFAMGTRIVPDADFFLSIDSDGKKIFIEGIDSRLGMMMEVVGGEECIEGGSSLVRLMNKKYCKHSGDKIFLFHHYLLLL